MQRDMIRRYAVGGKKTAGSLAEALGNRLAFQHFKLLAIIIQIKRIK